MKENSIKEDITRIKQRIEDVKEYIEYGLPYSDYLDLENSFDNILSDYKRTLKENEELRKELNEENKRCMMLAIEKQDYFEKYRYHLQQNENLTKEFSNVIPIKKVKDKIEELNKKEKEELKGMKGQDRYFVKQTYQNKRMILQELLESEE